ncbi:BTB/POZ domain-containing protein 2-like [Argopecten irradians]|uniref:BTB/POZ domain-containing protein 2-like n=1 Tax=Argopecten irradians TaxID=31199 RepID=UPI00371D5CA2
MAVDLPPSDWQVGKTLSESLDHLLTSGIGSDVTFIVGDDKTRFSAHKLVLFSRSPVFFAMFEGPMAEKGEITIPDISAETFKLFLRYLYTDRIHLTERNLVPVFNAARKYCVDILISSCQTFLTKNLRPENACSFLEQAHLFMAESLQEICVRFMIQNAAAVLQSVTFNDLCLDCLTSVTESDDLGVTETCVYEAIIRWAGAQCTRQNIEPTPDNKRKVLGKTVYTARYLHVEEDYLLGRICSDKVVPPEDIIDVINHNRNKNPSVPEKLNLRKRSVIPIKFHRNGYLASNSFLLGGQTHEADEALCFRSSVDVFLYGFGSIFSNKKGSVDFKILDGDNCLVEASKPMSEPHPDAPNIGDVMFDTPIKILAGKTYTLLEHSNNPVYHHFEKCALKITRQHISVEISCSPRSSLSSWKAHVAYLLLSG